MRALRAAAALAVALAALGSAVALDAPHDASNNPKVTCKTCHTLHQAPGVSLTNRDGNALLCESCHGLMTGSFGFPWSATDQATPGQGGIHHRWDAPALSPSHGAEPPVGAAMALVVERAGGNAVCSSCHDVHDGASANPAGARQHLSVPLGAPLARMTGAGTGSVAVTSVAPDAVARGYAIRIVLGGPVGSATFQVSNDGGTSWFGWNPALSGGAGDWEAANPDGRPIPASGVVALDDGTRVVVTFTGSAADSFVAPVVTPATPGDRWAGFYVSYPALRMSIAASELCEDCHRSRVQSSARVTNADASFKVDGVNVFSHPAGPGVTLSRAYDRTQGSNGPILDDGGVPQVGAGDGDATNDLVLDAAGQVRCLTCHSVHHADSNAGTPDVH